MTMFTTIPTNNRTAFTYAVELDGSAANTADSLNPTLIIGQKTASGVAIPNTPVLVGTKADADELFGVGSQAAIMCAKYKEVDSFGTLYCLPLNDANASVAATATITLTGSATSTATMYLYVNGTQVLVGIPSGTLAASAAALIADAINELADLPVTAAADSTVCTLTAKNKGLSAGEINVQKNLYGRANNETDVPGLSVAFGYTPGSGEPSLTTALANLGETDYPFIVTPYTSSTQINSIISYSNNAFNWDAQRYGVAFTAIKGTLSEVSTFGSTLNSKSLSVQDASNSPTSAYVWATATAACVAIQIRAHAANPLHGSTLSVLAPQNRRTLGERNTLLYTGISPNYADHASQVITDRVITTWQTNTAGSADNSFLDVETIYTLKACNDYIGTRIKTQFGKVRLLGDDAVILAGQRAVNTRIVKGALATYVRELEALQLVQNSKTIIKNMRVQRAAGGKLHVYLPLDIANQLREVDILIAFSKS